MWSFGIDAGFESFSPGHWPLSSKSFCLFTYNRLLACSCCHGNRAAGTDEFMPTCLRGPVFWNTVYVCMYMLSLLVVGTPKQFVVSSVVHVDDVIDVKCRVLTWLQCDLLIKILWPLIFITGPPNEPVLFYTHVKCTVVVFSFSLTSLKSWSDARLFFML